MRKHGPKDMPTGYTDEDNPFGDSRVNERFVWGKKIEKDIAQGATVKDFTASAHYKKHYERMSEIEKIQKRREQRERERAAMAEELELVQRERARAEAVELEKQEDEFHLEQAKVRAKQRLAAGRPKAIDIITNNLFLLDGFDQTAQDPNTFISGLTLFQLEELSDHIKEYSELDASNREHHAFWRALADVTRHTLLGLRRQEEIDKAQLKGLPVPEEVYPRESGWHPSLESDIAGMLDGKTLGELEGLESGIVADLDSGNAADPDYWSSVLRRIDLFKSKAVLREFHMSLMEKGLEKLRHGAPRAAMGGLERAAQARAEAEKAAVKKEEEEEKAVSVKVEEERAQMNPEEIKLEEEDEQPEAEIGQHSTVPTDNAFEQRQRLVERGEPLTWNEMTQEEQRVCLGDGSASPKPLDPAFTVGQNIIPEKDDLNMINLARERALLQKSKTLVDAANQASKKYTGRSFADDLYRKMMSNPEDAGALLGMSSALTQRLTEPGVSDPDTLQDKQLRAIAASSMGNDQEDTAFGGEVDIKSQVYWWHEKYKPRKPKYFNRVHTAFEWNKYNKAHYDRENPPPKVVQGYKFNIFYPDLIDPAKTPTYTIEKDPDSSDGGTCIIRFSGGPPYEDIAFRIVNKRWASEPHRGFKCTFDRGILQLYFNFQRRGYRR